MNPWMVGLVLTALMGLSAIAIIRFVPRRIVTRSPESYTPEERGRIFMWAALLGSTQVLSDADGYAQTLADVIRVVWFLIFAWVVRRHAPWVSALAVVIAAAIPPLDVAFPPPPPKWWAPYAVAGAILWLGLNAWFVWASLDPRRLRRRASPTPDH